MSLPFSRSAVRRLAWLVPALLALPARALAGPVRVDEPALDPGADVDPRGELDPQRELDSPPRASRSISPLRAPLTFSIGASYNQLAAGEPSFGAMVLLRLPLERIAARDVRAAIADDAHLPPLAPGGPRSSPHPKLDLSPPPQPPKLPVPAAPLREAPLRLPVVVTPGAARAAVDAALRRAHLTNPEARIDELAARARRSAGLPALQLSVTRTVNDGDTLSPTAYDPYRIVMVDDIRFSMEARATWRLDRLLFAREEIALERMRHERADAQGRLGAQVLRLLFEWQRARALAANPALPPEENLTARLKAIEAEAEVDLLTDGWFTRWREANGGVDE